MHYMFVYKNSLQMSHELDNISCVYKIACLCIATLEQKSTIKPPITVQSCA